MPPKIIDVPGQGQVEFPESMSDEQIVSAIKANTKTDKTGLAAPLSIAKKIGGAYADYSMGGLKGAADIGATLLSPFDRLMDTTDPMSRNSNQQRRANIGEFFSQNSSPESIPFQGGALASNIAGTAGAGGLLAKGAQAVGAAPKVISALETGGFRLGPTAATGGLGRVGDAAIRTGAGAAGGATAAGLVNPDDIGTGAAIGGALPGGVKVAGMAGKGLKTAAEHILGTMTGTSGETVKAAFKAGQSGSAGFLENMRGKVDFGEIVDNAKEGLKNMRAERGSQYRSGMVDIKADKTVLDMQPIVKAVQGIESSGNFKGKIINEKASGTIKEVADKVNDWAAANADEFHTPEGLDALKQAIGDIRDSTQFGTPARRAADNVYNAIKDQIKKQAPTYDKVMGDYSEASRTLQEIEKALSLGDRTSKDTAVRKLQSLMRNNAQTNYGNRTDLAKTLQERGGVNLEPAIAGQAMSSMMPRGMVGSIEKAAMVGAPFVAPGMLAAAPFTSPRLVGEMAYGAGRLSNMAGRSLPPLSGAGGAPLGELEQSMLNNPLLRSAILQMNR